jgi:hypothetical protein
MKYAASDIIKAVAAAGFIRDQQKTAKAFAAFMRLIDPGFLTHPVDIVHPARIPNPPPPAIVLSSALDAPCRSLAVAECSFLECSGAAAGWVFETLAGGWEGFESSFSRSLPELTYPAEP